MKKILILGISVCLFLGIERLCHKATDGFALNKIVYPLNEELAEELEPFSIQHQHAKDVLTSQSFHYLASGAQCYAFISDDEETILKFFKFQHMRIPPWSKHIPLPAFLDAYRYEKLAKKKKIIEDLFNSFQIANRFLKEETGMLFLHMRKTNDLNGTLTIYDKIGKKHELDLDTTYFVLQRRADLVYCKISEWMEKGKIAKAREGIRSLVALAKIRCDKGIIDKDPDFETNFGFIDTHATQIDIGRFSKRKGFSDPKTYAPEIIRITRKFRSWLKTHHEELVEVLDEEIAKVVAIRDQEL